jgi:hypothetical protein
MAEKPPSVGWPCPQILDELPGRVERFLYDHRVAQNRARIEGRDEPAPIEPTLATLLRVFDTEPRAPKRVKSEDEQRAEKTLCEALETLALLELETGGALICSGYCETAAEGLSEKRADVPAYGNLRRGVFGAQRCMISGTVPALSWWHDARIRPAPVVA